MTCSENPLAVLMAHSASYAAVFILLAGIAIGLDLFASRALQLGASPATTKLIKFGAHLLFSADLVLIAAVLLKQGWHFIQCLV